MEYLLTNVEFKNSKSHYGVFFKGDFRKVNDDLEIIEHNFVFDSIKFQSGSRFPGPFNLINFSKDKNVITLRNDELGMLPLYFAVVNSKVFVSNNIWLILEQLDSSEIRINEQILAAYLQYARIPSESETYFKNVFVLPVASTCTIDLEAFRFDFKKNWQLEQNYDDSPSIDDAVDQLYDDMSSLFQLIKKKDPDRTICFGNSGGLDSRLVPHFCQINDLVCKGFITGNTFPRFGLKSTSHVSAHQVRDLYKLEHADISYKSDNYEKRLALDIRNNLMSNCQIFKNPYDRLPDFDTLICGGNGFIVSNDSNKWKAFDDLKSIDRKTNFLQRYIGKFHFAQFSQKIAMKFGHSAPNKWYFDMFKSYDSQIEDYFRSFIQLHYYKDNLSIIRSFHQSIFNRNSPSGGFESINRTRDFAYLYYPFTIENSLNWPLDYYLNRQVLQNLMKKKIPDLLSIPDQKGQSLSSSKNSRIAKLSAKIRGNGLDYRAWYNSDQQLHAFMNEVFSRKNPMFDDFIKKELNFKEIKRLHPFISLDFLKAKKTLDIVYYQEFAQLKDAEFIIA